MLNLRSRVFEAKHHTENGTPNSTMLIDTTTGRRDMDATAFYELPHIDSGLSILERDHWEHWGQHVLPGCTLRPAVRLFDALRCRNREQIAYRPSMADVKDG